MSGPADHTLYELCAGTAAVSLSALAGRSVQPLTGYMGGKRRWARLLCGVLGLEERPPERVVLVDGGPWGHLWSTLRYASSRDAVARILLAWDEECPHDLWASLAKRAPESLTPQMRVAQYLWLQARSVGSIPVWWSAEEGRWASPSGSRVATGRALGAVYQSSSYKVGKAHPKGSSSSGLRYPGSIARRVRALNELPWDRIEVVYGDVREVTPVPGAKVYFDPPYQGCPRYAKELPREDVVAIAARWAAAGAHVVVSEAEPLTIGGGAWWSRCLPGHPREWLTCSQPIAMPHQLSLFQKSPHDEVIDA